MDKTIYILHEYGANSHYRALKYFLYKNKIHIKHIEFSITKNILKSILKLNFQLFSKQIINIIFILNLTFTKNKKIVLAVAPYDFRLLFLKFILRNHKVYYHTSWTSWDKTYFPKKLFVNRFLIKFWEDFLRKDVINVFSVTQQTKDELIKNIGLLDEKIKVVYHSYDNNIFHKNTFTYNGNLKFLYVGRFVGEKGIEEILEYFARNKNINLSLVGSGDLKDKVLDYSKKHENIKYLGYISKPYNLAKVYENHHFLLLNSKKVGNWEELFGMVIIEAMASGVIPITTNHKGPLEIIENRVDGYIFNESEFIKCLNNLIVNFNQKEYQKLQTNTLEKAKKYTLTNIAKKWKDILND